MDSVSVESSDVNVRPDLAPETRVLVSVQSEVEDLVRTSLCPDKVLASAPTDELSDRSGVDSGGLEETLLSSVTEGER